MCGKKGHFARDCWSRANQDRTVNEVGGAKTGSNTSKEFVFAIEKVVKDVSLSQSGCEVSEYGLVMIDSRASVNACPKWFGKSTLQKSDGSELLRGADGRTLQVYGKRKIWLKIGNNLKRSDFHVVEVTKPILSVSYLCEHGIETHLAREPFPEGRRQTVCTSSRRHAYEKEIHKIDQYEQESHKIDEQEQRSHKIKRTRKISTKLTSTSRRVTKLMSTSRRFT